MPKATETENFIKTLAELQDEECDLKQAELRLRIRTHAKRFVEEFRVGFQDRSPPSQSVRQADQATRAAPSLLRRD